MDMGSSMSVGFKARERPQKHNLQEKFVQGNQCSCCSGTLSMAHSSSQKLGCLYKRFVFTNFSKSVSSYQTIS